MEAKDASNSSYVWKSILAAQEVLKRGCCWRVGIGSDIRVMTNKWIPNYPGNMVIYQPQVVEWEWRVVELIDWTIGTWDRNLIETKFHKEDANAILRIPLSRRFVADSIFWLFNRDGFTLSSRDIGWHAKS